MAEKKAEILTPNEDKPKKKRKRRTKAGMERKICS